MFCSNVNSLRRILRIASRLFSLKEKGNVKMIATSFSPSRSALANGDEGPWTSLAELVRRAQGGDRDAFGALVEQFQRTVYSVCLSRLGNHAEALELSQDVFLHAMRRLDQLREPERFAGWLRQIAARMAINRATRRLGPSSVDGEILEETQGRLDNPLDELIAREREALLREALDRLKPLDREALVSFYIRSRSLAEIAEELEAPIGTIKRRLHVARKRLRDELQARAEIDEWTDSVADSDSADFETEPALECV